MKARLLALACAGALLATPAAAPAAWSTGSTAWLRAAVTRLINAELAGDGATACGILYAPLTATVNGRTCAQRWDARLARLLAATAAPPGFGRTCRRFRPRRCG